MIKTENDNQSLIEKQHKLINSIMIAHSISTILKVSDLSSKEISVVGFYWEQWRWSIFN